MTVKRSTIVLMPMVVLVVGVLFMSITAGYVLARKQTIVTTQTVRQELEAKSTEDTKRLPVPIKLLVPGLVNIDLEEARLADDVWEISEKKATHLEQSANPGESGNIIIYGHNKPSILGNIRRMKQGDRVFLTAADGMVHHYQVFQAIEVDPTQMELLAPTEAEVLTLYTCSGWLDRKRWIVQAGVVE